MRSPSVVTPTPDQVQQSGEVVPGGAQSVPLDQLIDSSLSRTEGSTVASLPGSEDVPGTENRAKSACDGSSPSPSAQPAPRSTGPAPCRGPAPCSTTQPRETSSNRTVLQEGQTSSGLPVTDPANSPVPDETRTDECYEGKHSEGNDPGSGTLSLKVNRTVPSLSDLYSRLLDNALGLILPTATYGDRGKGERRIDISMLTKRHGG